MINKNEAVDKSEPLVSILLAVYNPKESWFIEQLKSLNNQTYTNLNLYVYDDCPDKPFNEALLKNYITNFNYKIIRGKKNLGSTLAFEQLTKTADGKYFAYCDQDDVWESNKISETMQLFKDKNVTLAFCDASIIDENGLKTSDSIRNIRKRIIYKKGYNLAENILVSNFITGCTMIVRKDTVLKALPFEKEMIHDRWIGIIAALDGKIDYIDKPLIRYRQHSNNQTGILKGIKDKQTYCNIKINNLLEQYNRLKVRFENVENAKNLNSHIEYCIESLKIRKEYFDNPKLSLLIKMLRNRKYYGQFILFEMCFPIMPDFIFKFLIHMVQKGKL